MNWLSERLIAFSILASGYVLLSTSALADCYDVSVGEPRHLEGRLTHVIFPGPPEYQDVQRGDTPEPGYLLKLPSPICIKGDDNADPNLQFDEVHLVSTEKTEIEMQLLTNLDVIVGLTGQMSAVTGHHHRPLVAWVDETSVADDETEEYGTSATVVRAFYYALAAADGASAASLVVPEKRAKGPLSATELSRFYGSLVTPLRLIHIGREGEDSYNVSYTYQSSSGVCRGRATISTQSIDDLNYIERITVLNGC